MRVTAMPGEDPAGVKPPKPVAEEIFGIVPAAAAGDRPAVSISPSL